MILDVEKAKEGHLENDLHLIYASIQKVLNAELAK